MIRREMRAFTRLLVLLLACACRAETPQPPPPVAADIEGSVPEVGVASDVLVDEVRQESQESITEESRQEELEPLPPLAKDCCRICRTGKACGDACIAAERTCHKPPGCACNE